MYAFWDNKTFPLSFIRIHPLFHSIFYFHGNKTFLSTSSSWFSYLIDLLSCYKLGKIVTSFESPYMVCTCCVIWLEVQVVEYKHIRMLSLSATLLKLSSFWILEHMQHVFSINSGNFLTSGKYFWKYKIKIVFQKIFSRTYNYVFQKVHFRMFKFLYSKKYFMEYKKLNINLEYTFLNEDI